MTNISRVDESFVDYLQECKSDKYNKLLSQLTGVKPLEKEDPKEEETQINFVVYFDISLYEAPPVILKLEEKLLKDDGEAEKES